MYVLTLFAPITEAYKAYHIFTIVAEKDYLLKSQESS